MKSLPRILGLAFLALILTLTLANCSLFSLPEKGSIASPEKGDIASRLEPSLVKLSYRNQSRTGTGFFVSGETGVCTILTAAHVVKEEGERLLLATKNEVWPVANVKIFPSDIDLALVTFRPEGGKCNYPSLKIGNSGNLNIDTPIYILSFPAWGGESGRNFVPGSLSVNSRLEQRYLVSYDDLTTDGMGGAPVVDVRGELVAVYGMSDVEIEDRGSGIPINLFKKYLGSEEKLNKPMQESPPPKANAKRGEDYESGRRRTPEEGCFGFCLHGPIP